VRVTDDVEDLDPDQHRAPLTDPEARCRRRPTGELVLKARDSWPRTAKVYCHRAERWPEDPEIIEQVPIRSCQRRGVAIDLVLDRPRENRSQLVFTRIQGGREGIFWQSARTTRQARPGIRVPRRRAAELAQITIIVDTRERYPYKFTQQRATTERRALPAGDYGITDNDKLIAVVERKSLDDLVRRLIAMASSPTRSPTWPRSRTPRSWSRTDTPACSSWTREGRGRAATPTTGVEGGSGWRAYSLGLVAECDDVLG
jgi:hypothetical protein